MTRPTTKAAQSTGVAVPTKVGYATPDQVIVRGADLAEDLLGKITFTEMAYLALIGERPSSAQCRVLDAVLVSLVDHGVTPSVLAARLTYSSAPEAIQGAIASGLLGGGSVLLGSMEGAGELLVEITGVAADGRTLADAADEAVRRRVRARERVPGVGHALHKDGDPRVEPLLAVADDAGMAGRYVAALRTLPAAVEDVIGRRLPLNATGAVAALLLELGLPWRMHRGVALASRAVGLLAHVMDEAAEPISPHVREMFRGSPEDGASL